MSTLPTEAERLIRLTPYNIPAQQRMIAILSEWPDQTKATSAARLISEYCAYTRHVQHNLVLHSDELAAIVLGGFLLR